MDEQKFINFFKECFCVQVDGLTLIRTTDDEQFSEDIYCFLDPDSRCIYEFDMAQEYDNEDDEDNEDGNDDNEAWEDGVRLSMKTAFKDVNEVILYDLVPVYRYKNGRVETICTSN